MAGIDAFLRGIFYILPGSWFYSNKSRRNNWQAKKDRIKYQKYPDCLSGRLQERQNLEKEVLKFLKNEKGIEYETRRKDCEALRGDWEAVGECFRDILCEK